MIAAGVVIFLLALLHCCFHVAEAQFGFPFFGGFGGFFGGGNGMRLSRPGQPNGNNNRPSDPNTHGGNIPIPMMGFNLHNGRIVPGHAVGMPPITANTHNHHRTAVESVPSAYMTHVPAAPAPVAASSTVVSAHLPPVHRSETENTRRRGNGEEHVISLE